MLSWIQLFLIDIHESWTQLEMYGAKIYKTFYAQSINIDAIHQSNFYSLGEQINDDAP